MAADSPDTPAEYFLASDASAVIEHTKRVIFLEDDDVAFIQGGGLTIHRNKHNTSPTRAIQVSQLFSHIVSLRHIFDGWRSPRILFMFA
jgi:glucosamine--fructose-6-phosphate aminotransferase (isomerizing)